MLHFSTFTAIAAPTERLQVILCCQTAFGNGDNVVDLQKQVRLLFDRHAAAFASEVVALFDVLAQLAGHECALSSGTLLELYLFR